MRWEDFRASENVEDRRGGGGGFEFPGGGGGGGFSLPGGGGGLGIGTIIILGILGWVLGIDPRVLIGGADPGSGRQQPRIEQPADPRTQPRPPSQGQPRDSTQQQAGPRDEAGRFAAKILGNTEDVWKDIFLEQLNSRNAFPNQSARAYRPPRMVLFSGSTTSRCGRARSAMGPFYCPLDQTVYVDLSFFNEMRQRFRAGGDFAYAYVIAHEVGHHIQNQLGILSRVQQRQQEVDEVSSNQLSVRIELMADCLAGVWAHHSNQRYNSLEQGDIEEAITAAQAIGDDRLQRASQGFVVPDSFTHGSSEQRVRWLQTGLRSGQMSSCDTFRASRL